MGGAIVVKLAPSGRRIRPAAAFENPSAFANADVETEYKRVLATLGDDEAPEISGCLGVRDVLRAHFLLADFFYSEGSGMGGVGPRDMGLLQSAVHRQYAGYGGTRKWEDKFDICATLLFGLVMDHPFHDANKRTAMLCALHHLSGWKRTPKVSHKQFEDFIVSIAERELFNFARYNESVRKRIDDPEVRMIAYYLRSNTRVIDTHQYTITFWDLKRILNRFGFDLQNSYRNHIDVVRLETKKRLFRRAEVVPHFILQIGLPSWTKQVGAETIRSVRKATGLTWAENHVDSQSFFFGVDDVRSLIAHYQEPLLRLASR
jgi:prophage maintenance system killer protein